MAEYLPDQKKLTLKLVYYGPAQSGKTTNLIALHELMAPDCRGDMLSLETKGDRTLFFDFLPFGFLLAGGLQVKVKLYTVPGQVAHDSTRKVVLSRADGVVFVADSQCHQSANNEESFTSLADNCDKLGMDFTRLPLTVQFNKRDLQDITGEEEIRKKWSQMPWPVTFASALDREGVADTFLLTLRQAWRQAAQVYGLPEESGIDEKLFSQPPFSQASNGAAQP